MDFIDFLVLDKKMVFLNWIFVVGKVKIINKVCDKLIF